MDAPASTAVHLTRRERDILRLIAQDYSNAQIAEHFVLANQTVLWNVKQIYSKLGLTGHPNARDEAMRFAAEMTAQPKADHSETAFAPETPQTRTNLPARTTSFIGREPVIADLRQRLLVDHVRLLTLVGPPGIGKTSLSVEAGNALLDDFADGVYFVALAPLTQPEQAADAILQALNLQIRDDKQPADLVRSFLQRKHLLLVLDNFEHLLPAAALVADLLTAAPNLKVLATSREPLRIYGEYEYAVPPLSLPDKRNGADPDALSHSDAVNLFVQRASAVKPDFRLTADNAAAIADICVRLDGLPLAIELAAARIKFYTPAALAERLNQSLSILTSGARDLPPRQQTLRSAIAWSYDLLNNDEQRLLTWLGVFMGGWSLEALDAVCAEITAAPLFDVFESLVDKSLVQQRDGDDDDPRFYLLETIREFALEKLAEGGDEAAARQAHADYFLEYAERNEFEMFGGQDRLWVKRMHMERANFRAALVWFYEQPDQADGYLRLVGALGESWYHTGLMIEGREAVHGGWQRLNPDTPPAIKAWLLHTAGILAYLDGQLNDASRFHLDALEVQRTLAPSPRLINAIASAGVAVRAGGDFVRAESLLAEALAMSRELADDRFISAILRSQGAAAWTQGNVEQGRTLLEKSVEVARRIGNVNFELAALYPLGWVLWGDVDAEAGERTMRECLRLATAVNDPWWIGPPTYALGEIALHKGEYDEARRLLVESLKMGYDNPYPPDIALGNMQFALLEARCGNRGAVRSYLETAIALVRQTDHVYLLHDLYEWGAKIHLIFGLFASAAALWGAADAPRKGTPRIYTGKALTEYEQHIAALRQQLGDDRFEALYEQGMTLSKDEVLALVLEGIGE